MLIAIFGSISCSKISKLTGGIEVANNGSTSMKEVCKLIDDPIFETRVPYNGDSCNATTKFSGKNTPASSSGMGPSFVFMAGGKDDKLESVTFSLYNRTDVAGYEFFAIEVDVVARMITGKALPEEVRDAVSKPFNPSGKRSYPLGTSTLSLSGSNVDPKALSSKDMISVTIDVPRSAVK